VTACCCGHLTHFGECGEPITRTWRGAAGRRILLIEDTCHCSIFEPDDGTDGPSTAPGPHYNSDKYEGQYGTNRRYSK
jgi:hypothetical protein